MADRDMILLALDASSTLGLLQRALRAVDYDVAVVHNQDGLLKALNESSPALLVIGETFDGASGVKIAESQLERFPTMPILLFAEKDSPDLARTALNAGL